MIRLTSLLSVAVLLLQYSTDVDAHGKLLEPAAKYFGGYVGSFSHVISKNSVPAPDGKKWDDFKPDDVSQHILSQMKKNNLKLKDLVYKNMKRSAFHPEQKTYGECGFTLPDTKPQPLPNKIKWEQDAFHDSICAFFCDGEQVKADTAKCYPRISQPNGPVYIDYDKEKCVGKKEFKFVILSSAGLPEWQAYLGCIPLEGPATVKPAPQPTKAPTPAPKPTQAPTPAPKPTEAPEPEDGCTKQRSLDNSSLSVCLDVCQKLLVKMGGDNTENDECSALCSED